MTIGFPAPWDFLSLLAQTPPGGAPQQPGAMTYMLPAMLMAMVVFLMLTSRSSRKREERERQSMFSRLSKNDRVLTTGGIIGTIISVKDNEVILKVDETTNTKVTFLKSAIQRILTEEASTTKEKP
jgi:preprotein translocase subunit YajC